MLSEGTQAAKQKQEPLLDTLTVTEETKKVDNPDTPFPAGLKYSLVCCLLIVSGVSLASGRNILLWSSNISYTLQQFGGRPLMYLAQLFSTVLTVWTIPVVVFYNHLSNNSKDSYYHFVKFMTANAIGVTFKTLFYQGRPYLVHKDVYGCTCDPGMPSGHSIMAVSGYYMAYVILSQRTGYFKASPSRTQLLKFICVLFPLGIMWSRVQLAAHSLDQISIGALISLNVIVWFDRTLFERIYSYLEYKPFVLPFAFTIVMTIFGSAFIWINHEKREDTSFWLYWDKCPACLNTFVVAASRNVALVFVLPGFMMFYPYEKKRYTTILEDHFLLYERKWARFFVFLVNVCLVPGVIFGVLHFVQMRSITGIYGASFFWFKLLSPLAFYAGAAMSSLNDYFYEKMNLNQYDSDRLAAHEAALAFKAVVFDPNNMPKAIIGNPDDVESSADPQREEHNNLMRSTFSSPGTEGLPV